MFSHVILGANDIDASKAFYDAILAALGIPPGTIDAKGRVFYRTSTGILGITKPINGEPATGANGGTIGFAAASPELVEAWHAAGIAAGGTPCEDPPGERSMGDIRLYLAYLRDPAGNKLCALHRLPA
ncbi:glyoxalase [Niveispirillum lacus]|uniref:Glyoxalase n=1 Tax=Niveispirillum lacus TaxID=1981099 RepID=A0A255Z573_9PROT|nr:VOC family protein [Niveispirillum lacus]OYQ36025.1 glyoxalase [Niveispirillum lacus]